MNITNASNAWMLAAVIFILTLTITPQFSFAETDFDNAIQNDEDLRLFAAVFQKNHPGFGLNVGGAVFAPINKAFEYYIQHYSDKLSALLPAQHTTKETVSLSKYLTVYETYSSQQIWLQRVFDSHGYSHWFANDAKLLEAPKDFRTLYGRSQVVKIDQVIPPVLFPNNRLPSVLELIENKGDVIGLPFNLKQVHQDFLQLIQKTESQSLFNDSSNSATYFIPFDAIGSSSSSDALLKAHVIPGRIVFLRPWLIQGNALQTALNDSTVQAHLQVEFPQNSFNEEPKFIRSVVTRSLTGSDADGSSDSTEPLTGSTYTSVLLANIVLKNAVIHFIQRPLTRPTTQLSELISYLAESRLSRFFEFMRNFPNFMEQLSDNEQKTLFAFTNEAYERVAQHLKNLNAADQEQLLLLHLTRQQSLHSSQIISGKRFELISQSTLSSHILYATLENVGNEKWLYVEGGGVKARAVESNILGKNGNLHIVDKVLGLPYQTVMETLQSDPFLWQTYNVSVSPSNVKWGLRLNSTSPGSQFTVFAPSENAWNALQSSYGSYYKQIVDRMYFRNNLAILDRHLILNKAYSIAELLQLGEVKTLRSEKLKVRSDGVKVFLEWEGMQAQVERSDIHAVNGVIHAINRVLFKESDMKVSDGDGNSATGSFLSTTVVTFCALLIGFFY